MTLKTVPEMSRAELARYEAARNSFQERTAWKSVADSAGAVVEEKHPRDMNAEEFKRYEQRRLHLRTAQQNAR